MKRFSLIFPLILVLAGCIDNPVKEANGVIPVRGKSAVDQKFYSLLDMLNESPALVAFLPHSAQSNEQSARFLNEMNAAYGKRLGIMIVFAGSDSLAHDWAQKNDIDLPTIADFDLRYTKKYPFKTGPALVVVTREKRMIFQQAVSSTADFDEVNSLVAGLLKVSKPQLASAPSVPAVLATAPFN